MRALLIADLRQHHANTVLGHIEALTNMPGLDVIKYSPLFKNSLPFDLKEFDVAIIHYSIVCFEDVYLPNWFRRALSRFTGLKALFIQDEYRTVFQAVDAMIELGIDLLFTCVPEDRIDAVYGQLRRRGVCVVPTLTGYVPAELLRRRRQPIAARPLDVIYRGRPVPWSLGRLGQEKVFVAQRFNELAGPYGLSSDVDWREERRIYGDRWVEFLSSGRAALATESGASITDFTGEIHRAVSHYLKAHPHADYDEVEREVLAPFEGNVVINTISPRAFEAISLGTVLISFPGSYSGVLTPGRHYITLAKDFSNFGEVAEQLRDHAYLQDMADRTYHEVVASGHYSYERFVRKVATLLREEWERRCARPEIPLPAPLLLADRTGRANEKETTEQWHSRLLKQIERQRRNVARANAGASIRDSSPFFSRPHDPDYLLREAEPDGYAAALHDTPLPHWIEVDLGAERMVDRIEIEWFSEDNLSERFTVHGAAADREWLPLVKEAHNRQVGVSYAIPSTNLRRLRLSADRFIGQQRLLIRRLRVWSD